ncbi:MAG: MBL fold metallo-hydrolase [Bacillota bacterium]|nr:MBL fold metallo-hydrolase [Bacillota bacterium]
MALKFCSLSSGSNGNALYISTGRTSLLIDAGLSGKRTEHLLREIDVYLKEIDAILVTHDHDDHIRGVGVLCRRYGVPVYANMLTWEAMGPRIGEVSVCNMKEFRTNQEFSIGDICIKPYSISHDAADPVGFTFCSGKFKVSIANDLGCVTEGVVNEISGSQFLMLESNHDLEMLKAGPYPWHLKRRIMGERGHLSNEDAGVALLRMSGKGLRTVLLGHLSKENNYPLLALETVKGMLRTEGIEIGREMNIELSFRDKISRVYDISSREVY